VVVVAPRHIGSLIPRPQPETLSVGQVGVSISVSMHGFRISFGYNAARLSSGCHTSFFSPFS
jgi:hypothetical protein